MVSYFLLLESFLVLINQISFERHILSMNFKQVIIDQYIDNVANFFKRVLNIDVEIIIFNIFLLLFMSQDLLA